MPAISVVMPAYNAGRFLDAAVASILGQTWPDFELLALDDGSADDTLARLHAWAARDARVVVLGGAHRGLCELLNLGISRARAPWLARMDADDIARPDRFARQLEWLRAHPGAVAVGSGFEVIDEDGDAIYIHRPATDHAALVAGLYGGWGSQLCHPAVLMDRAAVQRAGGYRAEFDTAEDVDLFLRLAEIGTLGALPDALLQYRWHLRSVSHERRERQQRTLNAVLAAAWQRRGEPMPAATAARLAELTERARQPSSVRELREKIIWLAREHGHPRTARKHAARLLRDAWRERRAWRIWLESWTRATASAEERPAV